MALSQKKQQQKKAKRNQKRKQLAQTKRTGLALPVSELPIERCYVFEHLWDEGIGTVCIIRRSPDYHYYVGNYLIDAWGLGLKDTFVRKMSPGVFLDYLEQLPMIEESPSYCKALILAAARYSKLNGLKPNIDQKSAQFIENIPYEQGEYQFEFGKDGQPLYIAGPHDDEILPRMTAV